MARIQILELPTIYRDEGPDETPFILVIDQAPAGGDAYDVFRRNLQAHDDIVERTGARAVLCFADTIEIPANETPVDPDGYPLKIRVEGDFETFREQVQDEIRKAQQDMREAVDRRA
ncbi:hypothetical protein ACWCPF_25720 [Streptomyces sp. NPDC001858]